MSLSQILKPKKPGRVPKELEPEQVGLAGTVKKTKAGKGGGIGSRFQKELELTCQCYQVKGLAYIQMFATPTAWIPKSVGKNGVPRGGFLMPKAKTGFDFVGAYRSIEWKPIFIEAKSTEYGEIPVLQTDSGIKKHQIETLAWLEKQGLEAIILWQVRKADNTVYKFSISEMFKMIGERKSLKISDCVDAKVPRLIKIKYNEYEIYDFLNLLGGW